MAAASAGYGMAPPNPPFPAAWILWFQPDFGIHTSATMSESDEGVSFSVTRQNAGSELNAAAALLPRGSVNAPAATDSADTTEPPASVTRLNDSHAIGAAAVTRGEVATKMASKKAILMSAPVVTVRRELYVSAGHR